MDPHTPFGLLILESKCDLSSGGTTRAEVTVLSTVPRLTSPSCVVSRNPSRTTVAAYGGQGCVKPDRVTRGRARLEGVETSSNRVLMTGALGSGSASP